MEKIKKVNKGYGAGGSNTNKNGLRFEDKTNNCKFFIPSFDQSFFYKEYADKRIIYLSQNKFKKYMKNAYNIDIFRNPDEAYIIEHLNGHKECKIVEKKTQNVDGSVETKLWSGPALKREYEIVLGEKFTVEYSFCINEFLQKKFDSDDRKYNILSKILLENNIKIFYGDSDCYFEKVNKWIETS
jgi:acid phosphatase class B